VDAWEELHEVSDLPSTVGIEVCLSRISSFDLFFMLRSCSSPAMNNSSMVWIYLYDNYAKVIDFRRRVNPKNISFIRISNKTSFKMYFLSLGVLQYIVVRNDATFY